MTAELPRYAELQVATGFSFLEGVSHAKELVPRAIELGLAAIGITDRNTFAGVVRMHKQAKLLRDYRLVVGCRLTLLDGSEFLAWPTDRGAFGRLCRLLTRGKRRAPKNECHLDLDDVAEFAEGTIFAHLPRFDPEAGVGPAAQRMHELHERLGSRPYLVAHHLYRGDDRRRIAFLDRVAHAARTPLLATNDVRYHDPSRRELADVVTCIREKCRLSDAGFRLAANAERHLKPPAEMARLFKGYEHALRATLDIADACRFNMRDVAYEYPDEPVPAGKTAQGHLEDLVWEGARRQFPSGVPPKVDETIRRELAFVAERNYAPYFLTVHDIVRWARHPDDEEARKPILCQGRGSAANSVICYCLDITSVNPVEVNLLFERFLSADQNKTGADPPDIDVDFEHERREEVIQYIYRRYGRDRAGIAATVIHFRPRLAIREVGKVLGLTEDVTRALVSTIWGSHGSGPDAERLAKLGVTLADPRIAKTIELAALLDGMPRHLSQHVGGFVITRGLLEETVPVGNAAMDERTFIEWDKDDIDILGIFKIDILALGMLTCIQKSFDLLADRKGVVTDLKSIRPDDKRVYDMLGRADSIGVFQVESRAQMNMLPRLKPRCWYDLVIEVAIVRPGPIQGDMVHPFLRRRDGLEKPDYPPRAGGEENELKPILEKTMGVPLFQEQAMRIAMVAAEFTHEEAHELRKAMATFRNRGIISEHEERMVERMVERGYDREFAQRCFNQIKGFGEYGFPESHAASFAHLVYASSWIKCFHPDVFCAALLNSQPMGFYAPAQIVRDAREHRVEVRPPCINTSAWDCTLEPADGEYMAVRLGLRTIDGLPELSGRWIVEHRDGGYRDFDDFVHRADIGTKALNTLAKADAFHSLDLDRRQGLWAARKVTSLRPLPLFAAAGERRADPAVALPQLTRSENVIDDYRSTRLSLRGHPMQFLRPIYARQGAIDCATLGRVRHGSFVSVAGVVLIRQRPGGGKVVFVTIEDETGVANIVVWPDKLERFRPVVMAARVMLVQGTVERVDKERAPKPLYPIDGEAGPAVPIVHLVAHRLIDVSGDLTRLSDQEASLPVAPADHVKRPLSGSWQTGRHPRNVRVIPRSRDFH
jgi:error-prone DNA polymerase